MGSRAIPAALAAIYVALIASTLVDSEQHAGYGSALSYVVLGLCGIGVVLHVAIAIRARSSRVTVLSLAGVLALLAISLAALTTVTGDSL